MKESPEEIKDKLHNILGEVSFEHSTMKILSRNINLSEKYINELKNELPKYQDMYALEVRVEREKSRDGKSIEYKIAFRPVELYTEAMRHLRHITHSFLNKSHHRNYK